LLNENSFVVASSMNVIHTLAADFHFSGNGYCFISFDPCFTKENCRYYVWHRRVHSAAVFKRQLKTFLFDRAFNW